MGEDWQGSAGRAAGVGGRRIRSGGQEEAEPAQKFASFDLGESSQAPWVLLIFLDQTASFLHEVITVAILPDHIH